jgi:site-specific recombinase XerD
VFLAACRAVGVEFRPNEALRHAFGTHAVNRGVPLDRTGAYMGHTETKTTKRYAKLDTAGLEDVLRPR